jgi:hypothetical protein
MRNQRLATDGKPALGADSELLSTQGLADRNRVDQPTITSVPGAAPRKIELGAGSCTHSLVMGQTRRNISGAERAV